MRDTMTLRQAVAEYMTTLDALPTGAVITVNPSSAWIHLATGHWSNGPSCYSTKTLVRNFGCNADVIFVPEVTP